MLALNKCLFNTYIHNYTTMCTLISTLFFFLFFTGDLLGTLTCVALMICALVFFGFLSGSKMTISSSSVFESTTGASCLPPVLEIYPHVHFYTSKADSFITATFILIFLLKSLEDHCRGFLLLLQFGWFRESIILYLPLV